MAKKTGPEVSRTSIPNYQYLLKEKEKHIEGHGGEAISKIPHVQSLQNRDSRLFSKQGRCLFGHRVNVSVTSAQLRMSEAERVRMVSLGQGGRWPQPSVVCGSPSRVRRESL